MICHNEAVMYFIKAF